MHPETRRRLERIFRPSVEELESRTERTFEHWFEHVEYGG
jgi:hypothetical protein